MAKNQSVLAVALLDLVAHDAKAGNLVEADEALIKQLAAAGAVDPHKDAVAYARSVQAPVVDLLAKQKAEEAAAEAAAKEAAAVADLEAKLAAAPEADKPALEAELAKLRSN